MTSSKPYLFRAILEWIEDNQMTPYMSVEVNSKDVSVPMEYVSDGQIVLNISSSSIQLYSLDNKAIHFSARFNGIAQDIYVPMKAVMGIYAKENGQGLFFDVEEDQTSEEPEKSRDSLESEQSDQQSTDSQQKNKPSRKNVSHLKVIK